MRTHGCSTADFILNASVVRFFPLSKADYSNGHVQCTSNVKTEAIGNESDGNDNVEVCLCFQRHLEPHGRFNTSFNALFARYDTCQRCCVCCAAPLLGIALQITSHVNGDANNGSDASNVVADAPEEKNQEWENEEEENQDEVREDEEEEEDENTDEEDNVPCPD